MEDKLLKTILSNTYTKADLYQRLAQLRRFFEEKFFGTRRGEVYPRPLTDSETVNRTGEKAEVGTPQDKQIKRLQLRGGDKPYASLPLPSEMQAWGKEFYAMFNKDNIYRILEAIYQLAEKLPVLTLYVPIELPKEELPKLAGWFRTQVDKQIIMDVRLDRTLVGGCALVWQGIYRDFSLRFYLEKKKEAILEVISGFGAM